MGVPDVLPDRLHDRELFCAGAFLAAGGDRTINYFARWTDTAWSSVGPLLTFVDGKFQLVLTDQDGRTYGIEVSEDLHHWTRAITYTNASAPRRFIDEVSDRANRRFYRAVSP